MEDITRRDALKTFAGLAAAAGFSWPLGAEPVPQAPPAGLSDIEAYQAEVLHKVHLASKWVQTGLLDKLLRSEEDTTTERKTNAVLDMATVLDNQRLHNESIEDIGNIARFKRLSIPLISLAWHDYFLGRELLPTWHMFRPRNYPCFWHLDDIGGIVKDGVLSTGVKTFKHSFQMPKHDDMRQQYDLKIETKFVRYLAKALGSELSSHCVSVIADACGHHVSGALTPGLFQLASNKIKNGCGHHANFIIVHQETAEKMNVCPDGMPKFVPPEHPGEGKGMTRGASAQFFAKGKKFGPGPVYIDNSISPSNALVGYRGRGSFDGGAVVGTYVPLMVNMMQYPNDNQMYRLRSRMSSHIRDTSYYCSVQFNNIRPAGREWDTRYEPSLPVYTHRLESDEQVIPE
jgi:hypothetical protein